MAGSSHLKNLYSVHIYLKTSPSTLSYMKLKTIVHTFIYRIASALTKAKSILIRVIEDLPIKNNKSKNTLFIGSFRRHYNQCSSHVLPVASPVLDSYTTNHEYYDSTWNSVVCDDVSDSQLSGYLHWLEETVQSTDTVAGDHMNEIDRLADMFIASSHEKFRLEKVESYRKFQKMIARSV